MVGLIRHSWVAILWLSALLATQESIAAQQHRVADQPVRSTATATENKATASLPEQPQAELAAPNGNSDDSQLATPTFRLLENGVADYGYLIPFSYGVHFSDQYDKYLRIHWSIGPVVAELGNFDFALEADFFTGTGRDFFSFFIQPLIGSFNAAIRFTLNGFYAEYFHNSSHDLYPLAAPTSFSFNYYDWEELTSNAGGVVGLNDYIFIGFRSSVVDIAAGIGRKNSFSAVDGIVFPMYNGSDNGPMKLALFMYDILTTSLRLRLDFGFFQLALLHLNGFFLPPHPGVGNAGRVVADNINGSGRLAYLGLFFRLAPLLAGTKHVFHFFAGADVSYGEFNASSKKIDFAPLPSFSVGFNYRIIVPVDMKAKKIGALSVYDNGAGQQFDESKGNNAQR